MGHILDYLRRYWLKFLICLALGLFVMAIYNWSAGRWDQLISYSNGAFIGGAFLFLVGLLSLVNSFGAFDLSSFYLRRKQYDETRKENYGEYVTRKAEERKKTRLGFLPYVIVGAVFIIVGISIFYSIPVGR